MFNTGQITLPKEWRDKNKAEKYLARVTNKGLLITPLVEEGTVYYEDKNGMGIYCDEGLDVDKIVNTIEKINGQD